MNLIGISLLQLRSELQEGIRLQPPQNCPSSISDLIQQCFVENPTERPSFNEMKRSIEHAYGQLRQTPTTTIQVEYVGEEKLDYADIQFEERYLDMKSKNRTYQENIKTDQTTAKEKVVVDTKTLKTSFANDTRRYLSVQNMSSSHNPVSSNIPWHLNTTLNEKSKSIQDGIDVKNYPLLSTPGIGSHKRCVSYGGEDPTAPLQPELLSPRLVPAKSYPNPAYMMFLTELNKIKSDGEFYLNE